MYRQRPAEYQAAQPAWSLVSAVVGLRHRVTAVLGSLYQSWWGKLLLLLVAVTLLVLAGGLLATSVLNESSDPTEGFWWAFTHLLDPGQLGSDSTWSSRVVGIVLVFSGLVLLVGILFEVLTQVVDRSLSRLDKTNAAVSCSDHVVFDGWTWLLPDALRSLSQKAGADAVKNVVVVAPADRYDERPEMQSMLTHLGSVRAHLLFGDLQDPNRLARANANAARSIAAVGDESHSGDWTTADLEVVNRAITIERFLESYKAPEAQPAVFYAPNRLETVEAAAALLPVKYTPVIADSMISGMIQISLTEPLWGKALEDLANRFDLRPAAKLAGKSLIEVEDLLPDALTVGLRKKSGTIRIGPDATIEPDDSLITLGCQKRVAGTAEVSKDIDVRAEQPPSISVVVVGWNPKVVTLIADLDDIPDIEFHIRSIATIPESERAEAIADKDSRTADRVTFETFLHRDFDSLLSALGDFDADAALVTTTIDESIDGLDGLRLADSDAVFDLMNVTRSPGCPDVVLADLFLPHSAGALESLPTATVLPFPRIRAGTLAGLVADPRLADVLGLLSVGQNRPRVLNVVGGGPTTFSSARRQLWARDRNVVGVAESGVVKLGPSPDHPVTPGMQLLALTGVSTAFAVPASAVTVS